MLSCKSVPDNNEQNTGMFQPTQYSAMQNDILRPTTFYCPQISVTVTQRNRSRPSAICRTGASRLISWMQHAACPAAQR